MSYWRGLSRDPSRQNPSDGTMVSPEDRVLGAGVQIEGQCWLHCSSKPIQRVFEKTTAMSDGWSDRNKHFDPVRTSPACNEGMPESRAAVRRMNPLPLDSIAWMFHSKRSKHGVAMAKNRKIPSPLHQQKQGQRDCSQCLPSSSRCCGLNGW